MPDTVAYSVDHAPCPATDGRPRVGIFTASLRAEEALANPRVRTMVAEAALRGLRVVWFDTACVAPDTGRIRYHRADGDGVAVFTGPPPLAISSPVSPSNAADVQCLDWLRRQGRVAYGPVPGKAAISRLLAATPVARHVIPFASVTAENLRDVLPRFLATHGRIVLKPDANGWKGRRVAFLTLEDGQVVWQELADERTLSLEDAVDLAAGRVGQGTWTVQRFVSSRARGGRVFDVRVHTHKDGSGAWAIVRSYVRLSEMGLLVANTNRGGYQGDINHFFHNVASVGEPITARIERLGLAASASLERELGHALDELGIDILVDAGQRLWLVELNSRPGSRYHHFERASYAIAYAMHLADQADAGQGDAGQSDAGQADAGQADGRQAG